MFEEILSKENLARAQEALLEKNESCGVDGMMTSEIADYMKHNSELLVSELRSGDYTPRLVQTGTILGKSGKKRMITRLTTIDKLILRAVMQVLDRHCSPMFHKNSFAFQAGKGVLDAVKCAAAYIEGGANFVAEIDIEKCFDNIPHDALLKTLRRHGVDDATLALIGKYLKCRIVEDFEITTKDAGIVQGSPLSPLLCNLYLHDADVFFEKNDFHFVRYADDINIYTETYEKGLEAFNAVRGYIETALSLPVSKEKSGVFSSMRHPYLGYEFLNFTGGKVGLRKFDRKKRTKLNNWRVSAITQVDDEYHLIADGILVKKDFSLLFENPEKKMHIPVEATESINIYSDIVFSESFFEFISGKDMWVNIFNKQGEYLGAFVPQRSQKSSKTLLRQADAYNRPEERIQLARAFIDGAFHNMRENLKYYLRHIRDDALTDAIATLTACMKAADEAADVDALMLIEARARNSYYSCYNTILPDEDFEFSARSKRPPKDAINSLISFGNTVLYRRIASKVYRSRLDIRIGFLHATNKRPESLNLDIAEIFRPVIVDRVVFSIINKEMVDEGLHFENVDNGGIYMNTQGRKIFLQAFEAKMRQRVTLDGRPVSYEELIRLEVNKLANHIDGKGQYRPYKYFL